MTVEQHPRLPPIRRNDLTGGAAGGLWPGVHPYWTPFKLAAYHRGQDFEEPDSPVLRRGRDLEPLVAKYVADNHPDLTVVPAPFYLRDPALKLGASLDYRIEGDPRGRIVLECKTSAPKEFQDNWDEGREPPLWIVLQCLTQMRLDDAPLGIIACFVVDPYNWGQCYEFEVPRNPVAEAKLVTAVQNFWQMIASGKELEPDYNRDGDVIKALRQRVVPGKTIDLSGNNIAPDRLARRAHLRDLIDAHESEVEEIENEFRHTIGDAEIVTGLDGWKITYKTVDRAGYTVQPKTIRTLRIYDRRPEEELTK